jgi:hypothetical protein
MVVKINAAQKNILAAYHYEQFIEELLAYCEERAPGFTGQVGEERLKNIIRAIAAQAKVFGFDQRGPVRFYMDMVWAFGWECEHDPQYPWIMETRKRLDNAPQLTQAEELYKQLTAWHEASWGPNWQDYKDALGKIARANLVDLPVRAHAFERDMTACLKNLYLIRYDQNGEQAMQAAIQRGRQNARDLFHFEMATNQALVVLVAFMRGHAFMHHPIHEAWAHPEDARADEGIFDENTVAQRLAKGFRESIREEMKSLEKTSPQTETGED